MISKKKTNNQGSLFLKLEDILNQRHPIYILSNKVDWQLFDESFKELYCENNGRPAKTYSFDGWLVDIETFTQYFR